MLAYTNLHYENPADRKEDAFEIINEELVQLNEYIGENLHLNRNNFLFTRKFELDEWEANVDYTNSAGTRLNTHHNQDAKNNAFERLRNTQSIAKQEILSNEKNFIKAFINQPLFYWLYLESLFHALSLRTDKIRDKNEKILLKELQEFKNKYLSFIVNALLYFNSGEVSGLNYQESNKVIDEVIYKKNLNFDLKPYRDKIYNDFMKDAFKYYDNFDVGVQNEKWKRFFRSMILELYEYRNSELHYGKVNVYSELKLKSVLRYFINQIRWILIDTCEKNPHLSFEELLKKISS